MNYWISEMTKSQRVYGELEGRNRTIARVRALCGSLVLGREFGQSFDDYLASNPRTKERYDEAHEFLVGVQ